MADFSTLIASIEATIKQNGVQAITGQVLQDELLLMVSAINQLKQDTLEGYAFYGEALPNGATRVVTQNTFFLAGAGSYTINGNAVTIADNGISVIVYDCVNDEITTYTLFAYDANPTSGSANAVTSGGVKSALDTKADKNGASPDHFAGFAGNLVDTRSAGTRQGPFAFRQSGGDGVNYMRKILGRTEAFNQRVQNGNFASQANWGIYKCSAVFSGNIATCSITAESNASAQLYQSLSGLANHKYLLNFRFKSNTTSGIHISLGTGLSADSGTLAANTWHPLSFVKDGACTEVSFYVNYGNVRSEGDTVEIADVCLIDLTLEGLGLTTADQFRALHPLPYYNYNAGVLKNNAATGLETTGFNQWDEEWEVGAYDTTTGAKTYNATVMRCKNKIPVFPNTVYYFKIPNGIRYFEYDASGGYLGVNTAMAASNTFTTGANTRFITFQVASTTVYGNNICINRSDASRNGIYEPYWKRNIVLGLDSLACHDENNNAVVVNGLDGVETSQDELIVENGWGTKINKKMEEVDLGDLNYSKRADVEGKAHSFTASLASYGVKADTLNIISAIYSPCQSSDVRDENLSWILSASSIYVSNNAYTDAAAFKAAMAGVKLRFELATPKVLTLDNPIPALIEVDNLGTEKRLPEDTADNPQAPFECDSNYSISTANLVRKLSE